MNLASAHPRARKRCARGLLIVAAVLLPVGVVAGWASATLYDSDTFSQRAGSLLRSPAVRHEIAVRITDELARSGNQHAVNFRPALQLAVEGVIDTEAFRSIFRTGVAETHRAMLAGGADGVDLSEAVAVIATTLQLPDNARPGQAEAGSLDNTFPAVTEHMADLHVWEIEGWAHALWMLGIFGGLAAGASAIAVSVDRRRTVAHLGGVLIVDGVLIAGTVLFIQWYAGNPIADNGLSAAVKDAVGRWTGDLRSIGLWMAGYGVVLAAAAAAVTGSAVTPGRVASAVGGLVDRRRATTGGAIEVGAVAVLAGLVLIRYHAFWSRVAVLAVGLWLAYLGAAVLMGLVRRVAPTGAAGAPPVSRRRRNLGLVAGVAVALLALVSAGLVVTTRGASERAEASLEHKCNGSAALCDLPLDKVMIPATHNSMSSERYPGWMMAEHIQTIGQQLDSGVRALLIDTHYGIPSTARIPGSRSQLVVTDRAHELVRPTGQESGSDPNVVAKAQALAARVQVSEAKRGVYLCHNWCELGAIRFSEGLAEVARFLDNHPDEVVILDIEDHTTPADTSAIIENSGLADRAWTLDPNAPLPTLGRMIAARKNLLVLAEGGGPGAPPWYQPAYEKWVQETEYTWPTRESMDCRPKRGPSDAPLFLFNHWVEAAPPNPKAAKAANEREFLEARLRRCFAERKQIPNLVAVDFSAMGDLTATVRDLNEAFLHQLASVRRGRGGGGWPAPAAEPATRAPHPPTQALSPLPLSVSTTMNTFTGGDPAGFCAGWAPALQVVGAWAEAHLMASPSEEGLADLAYGAGAARALEAVADAAPAEVVQSMAATLDRARAAVAALRDLGVDGQTLDRDAESVVDASAGSPEEEGATPHTLRLARTQLLHRTYGADRVNAAARALAQAHPPQAGLFDLGDYAPDEAREAGYGCLAPSTG